jgi:hypothetical protein
MIIQFRRWKIKRERGRRSSIRAQGEGKIKGERWRLLDLRAKKDRS